MRKITCFLTILYLDFEPSYLLCFNFIASGIFLSHESFRQSKELNKINARNTIGN